MMFSMLLCDPTLSLLIPASNSSSVSVGLDPDLKKTFFLKLSLKSIANVSNLLGQKLLALETCLVLIHYSLNFHYQILDLNPDEPC